MNFHNVKEIMSVMTIILLIIGKFINVTKIKKNQHHYTRIFININI